jgi:hypothetical protein
MFVYIAVASAVNIFALGGSHRLQRFCFSSFEFLSMMVWCVAVPSS